MHGIEEGLLDKGCAEASDLLYVHKPPDHSIISDEISTSTSISF